MTTLTLTTRSIALQVGNALLGPVRADAAEQAAFEADGDTWLTTTKEQDKFLFAKNQHLITLSRQAVGLDCDDIYGAWRRLVNDATYNLSLNPKTV